MQSGMVSTAPVLVTGASGFIGSQIIADLLARGYRVRGTVRDLSKRKGYEHLLGLPGAAERLEIVAAELFDQAAFDRAVEGCEYVIHGASPYAVNVKDPQKDLVEPAIQGTQSALRASAKHGVKRVVLTSSMAAITDEPESDRPLTEEDWNEKSSLERTPYYFSKTLAEREAWRIVREESPQLDLVVINPFLVIGPSLAPTLNASNQVFVDLYKGVYPGILRITFGVVDVRDVSSAHVRALENPAATGRYICYHENLPMRELVEWMKAEGLSGGKLPSLGLDCAVGDFAIRLGSYLQPKGVGSYLRTHIGRVPHIDNRKIREQLGVSFRDLRGSVRDTLADLKRWGHL